MKKSIIFLFLLSILFQINVYAQGNTNKVLIATHIKSGKQKVIKQNTKIKVFTNVNGEPVTYKGRYTVINNESIELNGKQIKIDKINYLKANSKFMIISGIIYLLTGLTAITVGGIIYNVGINSQGGISQIIGMVIGIASITTGTVLTFVGGSVSLIKNKYDFSEKWSLSIAEKTEIK